jgi:MscS family membrane protein
MTMRRIKMTVGLTYSTTSSQMQNILSEIRTLLQNDSDINKTTIMIHFTDFQDSALGIFCYFFTNTTNWQEYLIVRERINLAIMKIVEENKASFAFPSQSVYIESLPDNQTPVFEA